MGRLIDQGKVIAAVDIQPDFSRAIAAGDSGRIQLLIDGRRSNSGQITASYLSAIAAEVGAEANPGTGPATPVAVRSEEHTSELQSLMRSSYAVFCLKKKNKEIQITEDN